MSVGAAQSEAFLIRLHWGVALAPIILALSGKAPSWPMITATIAFAVFAVAINLYYNRKRTMGGLWPALLLVDILLITYLVWARGGMRSDVYLLYYLAIIGVASLYGWRESLAVSLASGILYFAAVALTPPFETSRVLLRTLYFTMTGAVAGHLGELERRTRLEKEETAGLLQSLQEAHEQLQRYAEEATRQAFTDGLTHLYNHSYFHQRLDEDLARCTQAGQPLSIIFLDIDLFKEYNDINGHVRGNELLRQLADILVDSVRSEDTVARWGGEEFAIILPGAGNDVAISVAERIRNRVETFRFAGADLVARGRITLSAGVATYPDHSHSRMELIECADKALYHVKNSGRNAVYAYTA
ncbi:MAG: GGDEF domain-containing protein [Chloroflexota bacterium]